MLFTSVVTLALLPFMVQAAAIRKRSEDLIDIETFTGPNCSGKTQVYKDIRPGYVSQSFGSPRAAFKVTQSQTFCSITLHGENNHKTVFTAFALAPGTCLHPDDGQDFTWLEYSCNGGTTAVRRDEQAAPTHIAALD
ncbi:hypothetical protein DACRYDRAFT_108747 [Dacryopinax primogenitus]|uniref:AA1-like domain-containing protein n=1 Tax=Dacryopinax primogenitus (strain DJM 731) TaxID=1858805 RepID=M5FY22_DACPD|nr:uncharacterized protein DACRYDRAFT_108747 [Dacryopinax primogenitus]EJU00680.1 hypothetical protein DACRYDRAFT_108747 [Dacryopinax primogenitus]